jgi:hypothetical protein
MRDADGVGLNDPEYPNAMEPTQTRPTGTGPAKPAGRPRKGAEKAHVEARRVRVEQMELSGWSIRRIADELEVSPSTVSDDLRAIRHERRAALGSETIDELRDRERIRLESQHDRIEALIDDAMAALVPDLDVLGRLHLRVLQVHDRLVRLAGLAAPEKVEVTVTTASLMDKLDAYLAGAADSRASA